MVEITQFRVSPYRTYGQRERKRKRKFALLLRLEVSRVTLLLVITVRWWINRLRRRSLLSLVRWRVDSVRRSTMDRRNRLQVFRWVGWKRSRRNGRYGSRCRCGVFPRVLVDTWRKLRRSLFDLITCRFPFAWRWKCPTSTFILRWRSVISFSRYLTLALRNSLRNNTYVPFTILTRPIGWILRSLIRYSSRGRLTKRFRTLNSSLLVSASRNAFRGATKW